MRTSTTSGQNVPTPVRPGPGPWVGVAQDGSVIPAPYLLGVPSVPADFQPGPADFQPGPANHPSPTAASPRHRRADVAVFGAAALAGVMAIVAPFLVLWRYSFTDGLFGAQTVVNGWGAVSAHPASFATNHSHDTNYGLPLVLAAVFLLAGAATYAITRRAGLAALPTSAGASLAAATALLLALDRGGRDSAVNGGDSWAVGAGFWLILAAGGLGVVVALAAAVRATLELRAQAPAPTPWSLYPPQAQYLPQAPSPYAPQAAYVPQAPYLPQAPYPPQAPAWYAPVDPTRFTPPWAP